MYRGGSIPTMAAVEADIFDSIPTTGAMNEAEDGAECENNAVLSHMKQWRTVVEVLSIVYWTITVREVRRGTVGEWQLCVWWCWGEVRGVVYCGNEGCVASVG